MTVLFLISSEGYYGAENMVVALAKALTGHGCRAVIGVFRGRHAPHPEIAVQARKQGVEVEIVACEGKWDRRTVAQIRVLARELRAEILHPQGYKSDVYAYASARGLRCGLLATSHNWPSRLPKMQVYAALDRWLLRKFDRVVVMSEEVRQKLLRSGVDESKVCRIANGVDTDRFRAARPALRQELGITGPLIGYVGRLAPEKGGKTLLHAAERVLESAPGHVSFSWETVLPGAAGNCWPATLAFASASPSPGRAATCRRCTRRWTSWCFLPRQKPCRCACWKPWPPGNRWWPAQ